MTLTIEENAQLAKLKAQYLQLLDPGTLSWPRPATLKKDEAQAWLFKNLFDKQNSQYLPNDRYQARVLKIALARIEGSIEDPDQDVRAITSNPYTSSDYIGLTPPSNDSTFGKKSQFPFSVFAKAYFCFTLQALPHSQPSCSGHVLMISVGDPG